MNGDILKEIADSAKFEMDIFDGAIRIEGRILSPAEGEAAGLASALLASAVFKGKNKEEIARQQELARRVESGEVDEIDQLIDLVSAMRPDQYEQIAEQEDKLLMRCVRMCSKDQGQNWERLHLVSGIDQQDAKQNRLWVGMLKKEDRTAILERAMSGHKEAAERLKGFLSG